MANPIVGAKIAWNKSKISDLQLRTLRHHYYSILSQIEVSPNEFGSDLISSVRMKLMRVDDMIERRSRDR